MFHLPAYARKLNPVKGVWAHMKKPGQPDHAHPNQLIALVKNRLKRMQYRPALISGFTADYGVDVVGVRVGYIELKAPGRGVPSAWTPNKHEKTEWAKLRLLPNVLYTDGSQWALDRDGELIGQVAHLDVDIHKVSEKLPRRRGDQFHVPLGIYRSGTNGSDIVKGDYSRASR